MFKAREREGKGVTYLVRQLKIIMRQGHTAGVLYREGKMYTPYYNGHGILYNTVSPYLVPPL